MKKILSIFVVLLMVGAISVKAQSSSDSSYARNMRYTQVATSTLPDTVVDSLKNSDKILKDVRTGSLAKGYYLTVSQPQLYFITMFNDGWDSYLYLLDTNYIEIESNDDYIDSYSSRIVRFLQPGTYYILVASYDPFSYVQPPLAFQLIVDAFSPNRLSQINYTPQNTVPFTDTLGSAAEVVYEDTTDIYIDLSYTRGYAIQMAAGFYKFSCDTNIREVYVLDSRYQFVGYQDRGIHIPQAGTYRIAVVSTETYSEDATLTDPYTISIDTLKGVTYNTLVYDSIGIGDTIRDTITEDEPFMFPSADNLCYAKGYKIKTAATSKYIRMDNMHAILSLAIYVLDSNKNVLGELHNAFQVSPSTTYYFAFVARDPYDIGHYSFSLSETSDLLAFYVDAVNGNDTNNGLTPATAFATMDAAVSKSNSMGRYYITENYVFTNNDYLLIQIGEIYPYGKDIHLSVASSGYNDVIVPETKLVFGENGGNYYFYLDTVLSKDYGMLINGLYDDGVNYYEANVEINNVRMNSYHQQNSLMFGGGDVVVNNSTFTNDSCYEFFLSTKSLKLKNTTISNNYCDYSILEVEPYYFATTIDYTPVFEMDNTTIEGNAVGYPVMFQDYGRGSSTMANLKSGVVRNNTLLPYSNFAYIIDSIGNPTSIAGFWFIGATANIGAGFIMDTSNYLFVDTSAIFILENLSNPMVATIYPISLDDRTYEYLPDYSEGRKVLCGTESMLASNYSKFAIAPFRGTSWYLHSDGRIYTTPQPVGIEDASDAVVTIYPNPATDNIAVKLENSDVDEMCVLDIYGKMVMHQAVAEGVQYVDVQSLASGMYFVQFRRGNEIKATRKLIKR